MNQILIEVKWSEFGDWKFGIKNWGIKQLINWVILGTIKCSINQLKVELYAHLTNLKLEAWS